MMNFMREGGFNMWLLLATAIGVAAWGFTRTPAKRPGVFLAGTIAILIESVLGMATGMMAVANKYPLFAEGAPDRAAIVAQGLGELANDGTFGALLAIGLGVAAMVTSARVKPAAA